MTNLNTGVAEDDALNGRVPPAARRPVNHRVVKPYIQVIYPRGCVGPLRGSHLPPLRFCFP
jgi:hypothetical protein